MQSPMRIVQVDRIICCKVMGAFLDVLEMLLIAMEALDNKGICMCLAKLHAES